MRKLTLFSIFFSLFILTSNILFAQGVTTASLNGIVSDANGEGLPSANVIAIHTPSGTQYGVSTRNDGRFNLPNLRIGGPYTVKASFVGYTDQSRDNINLALGQNFRIEFKLQDASVEMGEVIVTAEQDVDLNSNRTGAATNISLTELEQLPTIQKYSFKTPNSRGGYRNPGLSLSFC